MRFLYKVSRINLLLLAADLIFSCFQCSEANFTHIVKQEKQFHVWNFGYFTSYKLGNFANF